MARRTQNYTEKKDMYTWMSWLDNRFRQARALGAKELIDAYYEETDMQVSRATVSRTVKRFENDYGAVFDKKEKAQFRYKYKDPSYHIPILTPAADKFADNCRDAINLLNDLKDIPQYNWLRLYLINLQQSTMTADRDVISFDNNPELAGLEKMEDILQAIIDKQPIKFDYQPFGKEVISVHCHPYLLKQFNNRWFLFAQPDELQEEAYYCYPLDRIVSDEILPFRKPYRDADLSEYFDSAIGVTVDPNKETETVELMVNPRRYNYIKTKPLHWSQADVPSKDIEGAKCIRIKVQINKELVSLLLSYGSDIQVIAPQSLKDLMRQEAQRIYTLYNPE